MELDVLALLQKNPLLVLFLILGAGLLLGEIRIAGVALGSVTGVLLIGLLFGHAGFTVPRTSQSLGFILFIYCVGVQAGPRFVAIFREGGLRYPALSFLTAATGVLVAFAAQSYFDFDVGMAAGLLAGALTSTPTLVAAQDAVAQGMVLPSGVSESDVVANISSAYAITYVFGMAGLVVFISLISRLFGIDVAQEAQQLGESDEFADPAPSLSPLETPSIRAYRIENPEALEQSHGERDRAAPGEVQKIKRGGEIFTPEDETRFELGDVVAVVGMQRVHEYYREKFGSEVLDADVLDRSFESANLLVTRRDVEGRTLGEMGWGTKRQIWLTKLMRGGLSMPRRADLRLQLGDMLLLTGPRTSLDEIAEQLGHTEDALEQTDLVTFAFGIALGLVLGIFSVQIGGTSIGLGTAGGVLLAGLLFGLLHSRRPHLGRLPGGARFVLMELGLLLFMTNIGISAGGDIEETFREAGPSLALCGVIVTLIPVLVCFGVGRLVFKMNAALLLGAVAGSMTSTAALQQVSSLARSEVPMFGYVGTYAFANVLLALAGSLIMRL